MTALATPVSTTASLLAVVDSVPAAIVITDAGGRIALVNLHAEKLFGYSRDQLIGEPVEMLLAARFRSGHPGMRASFFDNPGARQIGEDRDLYCLRRDGTEFTVEIGLNPIETDSGLFVVSAIVDVTDGRRQTEALRKSNEALQRSNLELTALNRELEAFSYSVSHDLRSPLRSMDGFSLALLEDYGDKLDAEGRDFLRRIRASSQRMGHLIDDLLGLSQVTRADLRLEPADLSEMARDIAASLDLRDGKRAVKWLIEEKVVVRADRALVRIALMNLLENAWKFTAKAPDAVIRFGTREKDGLPVIFVADNGAGFDMTYAQRLFGAFQRLHHADDFPGTGIGLATVHRIIGRHNGAIWAEARAGKGATFFFTLGQAGT